jgi:hypothetical protein
MFMRKGQWPIVVLHLLILSLFSFIFVDRGNFEFVLYLIVILTLTVVVIIFNKKFQFSNAVLVSLVFLSFLHLSGGGIQVGDGILYDYILIPLFKNYPVFRYDQLVHGVGFGIATFAIYQIIKPLVQTKVIKSNPLSFVIVMAALGLGVINEVIEFLVTVVTPINEVGDYMNNALDLVFNFIGALIGLIIINFREKHPEKF